MGMIIRNGHQYGGGDSSVELTQAEYNELVNSNSILETITYYITDSEEPNIVNDLVNIIYPIGSIYMSVNNVSPSTLFGGTWEQIKDTFLLSAGDTYSGGSTGGEASHTLTTTEMPKHSHNVALNYMQSDLRTMEMPEYGFIISSGHTYRVKGATWTGGRTYFGDTYEVGGGQAHNNMPPYLTVYVWKRIA